MASGRSVSVAGVALVLVALVCTVRDASAQFDGLLPAIQSLNVPSGLSVAITTRLPLLGNSINLPDFPGSASSSTSKDAMDTNAAPGPPNPLDVLLSGGGLANLPFLPPPPPAIAVGPDGIAVPRGILKTIANPPLGTRANPAAAGVVSASLFLASSICLTTAGGLGTAYVAASNQLALINQVGARVNLGFEWTKAILDVAEQLGNTQAEYGTAFLNLASGATPARLQSALQLRKTLSSGFNSQLVTLQDKIAAGKKALLVARGATNSLI